jgi:tetratricopeptide (TPR) repeat protein
VAEAGDRDHRDGQLSLSRRGGAGTFRGTNYQLLVGVLSTLDLIARQLLAPHRDFRFAVEGVAATCDGVETWDYVCFASDEGHEAKSKPTPDEIREWIVTASRSALAHRVLICGTAGGRVLKAARDLLELRGAASGPAAMSRLVAAAPTPVKELAGLVEGDLFECLEGMAIKVIPADYVEQDIQRVATQLAGGRSDQLVEALVRRLSRDAGERRVISVRALIAGLGVPLSAPAEADLRDLAPCAGAALAVLQDLPSGVPVEALAAALRLPGDELVGELQPLTEAGVVTIDDGIAISGDLLTPIPSRYAEGLPARLLSELLVMVEDRPCGRSLEAAIDAIVVLTKALEGEAPDLVASVFQVVDKPLKRRGDKRLVLDLSERSIHAAHEGTRSDAVVEAEAIALICGRSWVYQRVGQIKKARADGEKALRLGEEIGAPVTIAFCHKCLGRLCRMEAAHAEQHVRHALLARSEAHLLEAIERFTDLGMRGEVGDAYSLLGRTYFENGRFASARAAVQAAHDRLCEPHDKDYRDLRILEGDLAAAAGEFDEAIELYTEVIDTDAPDRRFSEIQGRALHERAVAHHLRGMNENAIADFVAASETFTRLREPDRAADSLVEAMRLQGRVPAPKDPASREMLGALDNLVLVRTIECHEAALRQHRDRSLSFRGEPTRTHWENMIAQGKRMAAKEREDW